MFEKHMDKPFIYHVLLRTERGHNIISNPHFPPPPPISNFHLFYLSVVFYSFNNLVYKPGYYLYMPPLEVF